jgi:hypothetical protein
MRLRSLRSVFVRAWRTVSPTAQTAKIAKNATSAQRSL